ncbi:ATP-binding protein [Isoptericola jiangsuensis]|uniref:ATP-binding protein n=1 Tax=Isoptericola jiangsuensis TaxID=548579 RepID=UPI003AADC6F4
METSQGPLDEVVWRLRAASTDLAQIEVKAAGGGLPKDIWPTVSAFSNGDGGLIILGLDEKHHFAAVEGFDATAIRDAVSNGFRPRRSDEGAGPVTPRPIGSVDIAVVDDAPVVVVDVEALPAGQRPLFVTSQGKEAGTYERVGDGDRRMSTYGVFLLSTNVEQPRVDSEPVSGATLNDLEHDLVERFVARLRRRRPRSVVDLTSVKDILVRHNVLASDGARPTLAGLLALGRYPQHFVPQAMVTFAVYPGTSKDVFVGEQRMLDRRVIEGPIPAMVEDVVRAVLQNIQVRRVVAGAGARDEPEIPELAIRESIANALTHRDYSPWALGDQVRVELFPDRLEIANPGGIWGGRRVVDLFSGTSRSRNAVLSALLADVPMLNTEEAVSENAGSGIPAMTGALGRSGLAAPRYVARVTDLTVVLDRHGLLSPETSDWLDSVGATDLDADLRRTLVLVHRGYAVDDQVLRAQLAMDSADAKQVLRRLVDDGWLQFPRRTDGAYRPGHRLDGVRRDQVALFPQADVRAPAPGSIDDRILNALADAGQLSVRAMADRLDTTVGTLRPRLRVLVAEGVVIATAPPTSRHREYRLSAQG